MRLTGGATYVVGGRVGMGETHQVKIHFNWSNLSSSSSIPTPYIYIYSSSTAYLLHLCILVRCISFLRLARDRPLLGVQFLQHFSKTAFRNAQFLPWQMKSGFLGSQFLQSFWNALFCTHSFYNIFCEEVSKNTRKTMLFVNAMARNVQKPSVFYYFLANLWNSLCCRLESQKNRQKPLYCRVFYSKSVKIVVLLFKSVQFQ